MQQVLLPAMALFFAWSATAKLPVSALKDVATKNSFVHKTNVYGEDNRKEERTQNKYNRRVGKLLSTYPNGKTGNCSAQLIGRDYLITAAHCITQPHTGAYPVRVTFDPQAIRGIANTHPREFATDVWVTKSWQQMQPTGNTVNSEATAADIAIVRLMKFRKRKAVGDVLGWYGLRGSNDWNESLEGFTMGYPGDKGSDTLWKTWCKGYAFGYNHQNLRTNCDTIPGQSGSGFFQYDANIQDYRVRAVLSASNEKFASYARITTAMIQDIINILAKGRDAVTSQFYHRRINDTPTYFLRIKNICHKKIYLAVRYYNAKAREWTSKGWYEAKPGQTVSVDNTASSSFYYYAASEGNDFKWQGDHNHYIGGYVSRSLPLKKMQTAVYFRDYTLQLYCN